MVGCHYVRKQSLALLAKHVLQISEPDRKIGLIALGRVQAFLENFEFSGNRDKDTEALIKGIEELRAGYSGPSGEYSSGRGEIGSYVTDLKSLLDLSSGESQ